MSPRSQANSSVQNTHRSSQTAAAQFSKVDNFSVEQSHRSHPHQINIIGRATSRTLTKSTDISMAESRLRIIERISKYREEKIKREFWKLELELQEENDKLRGDQIKEMKL